MIKKIYLILIILLIPNLAFAGFVGQFYSDGYNYGVIERGEVLHQSLGKGDGGGIGGIVNIDSLSLRVSREDIAGFDSNIGKIYLSCYSDEGDSHSGTTTPDCGTYDEVFQYSFEGDATTTIPLLPDYEDIVFSASTSIPIDTSKYYQLSINPYTGGAPSDDIYLWGALANPIDYYSDGKCFENGFLDCYVYNSTSTTKSYTDYDITFYMYGSGQDTTVINPIPSWLEIAPITGTSTTELLWGSNVYFGEEDWFEYSSLYVDLNLKYLEGGIYSDLEYDYEQYVTTSGSSIVSTSTDVSTKAGLWQIKHKLYGYDDEGFGTYHLLHSTTTKFYLGVDTGVGSETGTYDDVIDDYWDVIDDVECTITWTDLGSIIGCAWEYVKATADYGVDVAIHLVQTLLQKIAVKWPWGYVYRVYYIFDNPVEEDLPNLDIRFQYGDVDTVVDFTPWESFGEAMDFLEATSSEHIISLDTGSLDERSVADKIYEILNLLFGLFFVSYIIFRIFTFVL